jgi:hypothetical protein
MATNDQLTEFAAAGITVDRLTDEQRQILATLSPEEKTTLISVSTRLSKATSDVEGYTLPRADGGIIF